MSRSILWLNVAEESRNDGPSLAEIRERAFEIHVERGGIHGCDLDDWKQAERELQEKYNKSSASNRKDDAEGGTNASTTKRKTLFIGAGRSTAVGNSGDVSRARRALQLYAENRFLEIPHI